MTAAFFTPTRAAVIGRVCEHPGEARDVGAETAGQPTSDVDGL